MEQQPLFLEDINDALREAVRRLGGSKAVGVKLWPEKTVAEGQGYLNDCLNKDRPAKLSPEQVMLLLKWAREADYHGAMNYLTTEAGYANPQPLEPADELPKLLREYLDIEHRREALKPKIDERIEKLRLA